jgi:hypothetical protein
MILSAFDHTRGDRGKRVMERNTMSQTETKVGLIVDRNFGPRIARLAQSFHVWAIESPANTRFIREFWKSESQTSERYPLATGITSFVAGDNESPEQACARIAGDVNQHHGEFAHDLPWSELQVFGVELSEIVREVFKEIGATTFEPTSDGFICRRTVADHGDTSVHDDSA